MARLLLSFLFLLLVATSFAVNVPERARPKLGDQRATLQQIANLIKANGEIGPNTIGASLFQQTLPALHQTSALSVAVVNITIDDTTLQVWAKANIWGYAVQISFTFFFASAQDTLPQLQLKFNAVSDSLASLIGKLRVPANNGTLPTPGFASELNLMGSVELVLSTFDYKGFKTGITLVSYATIASSSNTLLPAFSTLQDRSNVSKIQLIADVFVPIFSANPSFFTLSLLESGTFALTSAIQCSNYQLNLAVSSQSTITLTAGLQILAKDQKQPVDVNIAANWKSGSSTTFKGTLANTWNNAFGLDWLTLNSATLTLDVGSSGSVDSISLAGQAAIAFAASGTSAQVTVSLTGAGDYLLSVSNLPIGSSLQSIYNYVTHAAAPSVFQGVTINGKAAFSVATYSAGKVQKGFTFTADVSVDSSSSLYNAAKVLQASPPSTYALSFYVPLFSSDVTNFQFSLTESGSFPLTSQIQVNGYSIAVSVTQSVPVVTVSANISISSVSFVINGQWDDTKNSISFTGTLSSVWQNAFGLDWLTIKSGKLAIAIDNQQVTSATLTGSATLSFASSSSANVQVQFGGNGNFVVAVAGLPLNTFGSLYSAVAKSSPPSVLSDLSMTGSIGFAVANFDSSVAKAGLTVEVKATINSQSSIFYKAAKVMQSTPSSTTYDLKLFVPIFGQQPQDNFKIDLSETGSFALSNSLSVDSYSIDLAASGGQVTVTINAEVAITTKQQAQPAVFDVSAVFSEAKSEVTFTGSLKTPWQNALGFNWLTVKSGSVAFVLGSSSVVDDIKFTASLALNFVPNPVSSTITIKGTGDFSFSVSGIPIDTLGWLFHSTTNQDPPTYLWGLSLQGQIAFTVSTYAAGSVRPGLTVSGQATLVGQQQLSNAMKVLVSNPSTQTYHFSFYLPLFSANPEDFQLTISESGTSQLTDNIQLTSYSLNVDIAQNSKFSLSANIAIVFAEQNQPIDFTISGQVDSQGDVSFSGALQGGWSKPFGVDWLKITGASISMSIGAATVSALSIQASGTITLDNGSEQVSLSLTTAENFKDVTVSATVNAQWTFNGMTQSIVKKEFSVLDDIIKQSTASFSVVLSTYNHGNVKSGLSFDTKGDIQGDLQKRVSSLSSKQNFGELVFEVSLNIPIFSDDPAAVSVVLLFDDEVPITPSFYYEGIKFELDAEPLEISVDATFLAKFKKNSPLTFDIAAALKADGEALFTGEMTGTWTNVFGFKGFNLSNVIAEFGVNPSMCSVDFCISDLGIGFEMSMGTKTIIFDGNAAAPDFEDIFVRGAIDGKDGMALTMRDVVEEWNDMVPALSIPISDVPQGWGLKDVGFSFAPVDGHFGNIYYTAGFSFTGGITLLDMDLDFAINCSDTNWDFCNFAVHIDLNWDLFKEMIQRELRLLQTDGEIVVFSIEDLSLTQWNAKDYAQGVYPNWDIQIKVLDKVHHLNFRVEQYELASSFSSFFKKWLRSIF